MIPNGGTFGGKHTYTDFNMIPKSKIIFQPPDVKTEVESVPGLDGVIDLTDALLGRAAYGNRTGTLDFIVLTGTDYQEAYSEVLQHFHGQKMNVVLDDDPDFYYTGRFTVNPWKSWEGYSLVSIDYDLEPYKHRLVVNTGEEADSL